ncbi:MAG: enoyl-CoA hydratase [Candidatus Solincola sediminis]|uniref:Enoyl-CoA hydratase n=1 Tax=Candidatus Solincola sediminis TaxID=1797199 RepID=A0A1F2WRA8_9ACTN|nr:MAG: enoyl-CoA hydratase [Candidatus Solincola sediminis]
MGSKVFAEKEGAIVKLFLNRPEVFNALDPELGDLLLENLRSASLDEEVRAVVIAGKGRAFSSGGDIHWFHDYPAGISGAFDALASRFHLAITEIRSMRKPVIAAINGAAAGAGFSLALACDFRVMERSAILKQAYTSSGLALDGGATFMLPRLVGLARALEIIAFDEPINADRALRLALVTRVCENGDSVQNATELAIELAGRSLTAFGIAKLLLNESFDNGLESHMEKEREGIAWSASQPDGLEGINAFIEKRAPIFGKPFV